MDELLSGGSSAGSSLMTASADENPENSLDYLDLGSVGDLPEVNDLDSLHDSSRQCLLMGTKTQSAQLDYLKSSLLASPPDALYRPEVNPSQYMADNLSPASLGAPLQYNDLVDSDLFKSDSPYFEQDGSISKGLGSSDTLDASVVLPNTGIDILDLHMDAMQDPISRQVPFEDVDAASNYFASISNPRAPTLNKDSSQFSVYKFPPDSQFQAYGYKRHLPDANGGVMAHSSSYLPQTHGNRHMRPTPMARPMHHHSYSEGFESDPGHRRARSVSKMPLSDLYVKMGLEHDPAEAKQREGRIMDAVKALGFDVGKKTWIRDTPDHERQKILDALSLEMAEYGYTRDLLDTIVRRGTYARMQSRLRQLRRHKRRESEANNSVSAF